MNTRMLDFEYIFSLSIGNLSVAKSLLGRRLSSPFSEFNRQEKKRVFRQRKQMKSKTQVSENRNKTRVVVSTKRNLTFHGGDKRKGLRRLRVQSERRRRVNFWFSADFKTMN